MLFYVNLCVVAEFRACMKVSKRADSKTVRRMELAPQKLTAGVLHFKQLKDVGGRQQVLTYHTPISQYGTAVAS